ncbi:MAG: electron transfer flavoprotein alpha/ beta subunit, partial [Alphaproteobacteria bacterium]
MLKIAVCVKQVPEVAELTLDPVTKRLRREGVPLTINPFDRRAVLEAVQLKESTGAHVVAISMGPPSAETALRECLGLGVDRAIHLCDVRFGGSDTLATSRALAQA